MSNLGVSRRVNNYPSWEVDDITIAVPVHSSLIGDVAVEYGISEVDVAAFLASQQADVMSDGTRIGFIGDIMQSTDGCVTHYTDNAVYLCVDSSVWEKERDWFDVSDDVFEAGRQAQSREIKAVQSLLGESSMSGEYTDGYVVGVDFPIKSVVEHDDISVDPYPVAERSEFLRFEAGLAMKDAQIQSFGETFNILGVDAEESLEVIADVLEMEIGEVAEIAERVNEWRSEMKNELSELGSSTRYGSDGRISRERVFEYVASNGV